MISYNQKFIIFQMLKGCFLKKVESINAKYSYRLYYNSKPILLVTQKDFNRLKNLFKEDSREKNSLNLNKIRQKHGNSFAYKTYKLSKTNTFSFVEKKFILKKKVPLQNHNQLELF